MKKLILLSFALLCAGAYSAPMASQKWVDNKVDTLRKETDARVDEKLVAPMEKIDRVLGLVGDFSPELTNEYTYVSTAGTNSAFIVSDSTIASIVDTIAAWDRVSDKPKVYKNVNKDFFIYEYNDFVEIKTNVNSYISTTTDLVSTPIQEITAVTNRTPIVEYVSTPIWVNGEDVETVFEYIGEDGNTIYVTNRVAIPSYISGYETRITTNSWDIQISTFTNLNFSYTIVTNTTTINKEFVTTNVYDKIWAELNGERFEPLSHIVYWDLHSPSNSMTIFRYGCNEVEWYKATIGAEPKKEDE